MKKVAFLPSLFCFSKLNSIYLAFPAIINRSGDAFVLQYNILFKRRVALYINFWLLCLEIIPSEETVADAMTYYVQAYATVCVAQNILRYSYSNLSNLLLFILSLFRKKLVDWQVCYLTSSKVSFQ